VGALLAHDANVVTVRYSLSVPANIQPTANIQNTAVVSSACAGYSTAPGCVRDAYETFISDNTASALTSTCAVADVAIVKSAYAGPAVGAQFIAGFPNQAYSFKLAVSNLGVAWAYNVTVQDFGFNGGTITSVTSAAGASCTVNPPQCFYPSMANGATDSITVGFTIGQAQPCGPYLNRANISTITNESTYDNNQDSVTIDVKAWIDLVTTKTADLPSITAGTGVNHYTITVTNAGYSRATNVVLKDFLPLPTITITSLPVGCEFEGSILGLFRCNFGAMDAGATRNISFPFTVGSDAVLPPSVTNTAFAFSPSFPSGQSCANYAAPAGCEIEMNPANNCASVTVGLVCSAALTVSKNDGNTVVTAGDTTVYAYTIVVTNNGPSTARSLSVQDTTFPFAVFSTAGSVIVQGRPGASCPYNVNGFTCQGLGDLASGASLTIVAPYTVNTNAAPGDYTNTVTAGSACSQSVTATDTTTVSNNADVSIIKDDCESRVVPGNLINGQPGYYTFTFTVHNAGPSRAYNVLVTDTVPALYEVIGSPLPGPGPQPACNFGQLPNNGGYSFSCRYAELAVGATATITLEYWVASNTPAGYVTNCATVTSNNDLNPTNNVDCDTNYICPIADLAITKKLLQGTCILAGGQFVDDNVSVYQVTVTNLGPSTARDGA
jgi:uncharacterized repeat protein (TIGR01451 family)